MERRKMAGKELMEMNKSSKGLLLLSKEGLNIGDDFS